MESESNPSLNIYEILLIECIILSILFNYSM